MVFFQAMLLLGYVYAHALSTRVPATVAADGSRHGADCRERHAVVAGRRLDRIAKDNPEIALNRDGTLDQSRYWFNTEGFVTAAAAQPASYQKRAFPFRVNNLRGPGFFLVNANIVRNFSIGGSRSLQFRLDVQNLLDSVLWQNPDMNPTSTNFGKVTGATNSIMRFFTFVWKVNF